MKFLIPVSMASLLLTACAQPSRQVIQSYVPTAAYANYSCSQLSAEMQRIVRRYADLAGIQDENARGDAIKVGLATAGVALGAAGAAVIAGASSTAGNAAIGAAGGAALGGSSLIFIHGDDSKTNQIALLKGELDAAERAFIEHDCTNSGRVIRTRG